MKTEKPLVSFIIPIYNVAPYLEKCIMSVLNQSFENYEIIAVNDGSTDNSGEILEKFGKEDVRVHVIIKKNGGVSSARNAGIAAAKGTWLYFVDGDDFLLPDSIAKVIPYLDDRYDVVMTGMRTDENKSDSDGLQIAVSSETDLTREFDTIGWFFAIWGMFFKHDIFLQNNLRFDEKMVASEDHAFAVTWLMITNRILALKNETYFYYIREESLSHTSRDPRSEMGSYDYYCRYLNKNPLIIENSKLFCYMFVNGALYKQLEGLALDHRMDEMRKIMNNPLVIRALSNATLTRKDKVLVCNCIRKKAVLSLYVLFHLKNMARKIMPIFRYIKKHFG